MNVIKRDESVQPFEFKKVEAVLNKAFDSVEESLPESLVDYFKEVFEKVKQKKSEISVEEIQDIIQKELIRKNKFKVVESFINYRRKHAELRENKSDLIKQIRSKLNATNIENQNANVDEASFGGRVGEAASVVCKHEALKMMSKMARKNHENNMIYVHDMDSYADGRHNCLTIPIDKALAIGFHTRQTDVRPAGSVNTAMQLVAVVMQCQSLEQFGGVAVSHLDWTMVPYIRKSFKKHFIDGLVYIGKVDRNEAEKLVNENVAQQTEDLINDDRINYLDKMLSFTESIESDFYHTYGTKGIYEYAIDMTTRETYQAVEGMYHNLNTLQSRAGAQLPFSSINYGTCTLPEGRMLINAVLDVSIKGLGKSGVTSIFPCGIFQCMKGVNDKPGTPNYDLKRKALESCAKRIYPNFANVDWNINEGYDKNDPRTYMSTMGCRTYNGLDINALEWQNPQLKDGRGNLAPVTIILPTLAMIAKEKVDKQLEQSSTSKDETEIKKRYVDEFMKLLDKKIFEARDMLLERFKHMASQPAASAKFMYENGMMFGYKPEEGIISALKHGTLVIGKLGWAEASHILLGCDQVKQEGFDFIYNGEKLFNTRCKEFKNEYKLNFGNYNTPAENLCHTALKKFRQKYGIIENVSDREYFTNSIHVPVWHKLDLFKKIDIESKLAQLSNAGCITYIELESNCYNNIDAMEKILDYSMEHQVPYQAFNFPIAECRKCGQKIWDVNVPCCPKCGHTEYRNIGRVTGYLSTEVEHFNHGKQDEFYDREKHTGCDI